ncbi:MAG: Gfo/Idh/MocA family oxidoreductase [Chloroflexi bacterium]|nr:Gfo/Idh/MocA family oxidoreductase [Chloroflexota bacterium]
MGEPLRIGVVGLGTISGTYLDTLARLPNATVVAAADRLAERAESAATQWPGIQAMSVRRLLTSPSVDLVLNLTVPRAHTAVSLAALRAGKHVYSEKPLALSAGAGRRVLELAERVDRRVGCAPDTILGTGVQTARRALDDGLIGVPFGAVATMTLPGHEAWHPAPEFYYQPGGGPLLDMGPYYLTALVHLLGPIVRVSGASRRPSAVRTIASGPRQGVKIPVAVDTHLTGVLEHASGALTTIVMSFDTWAADLPAIEVYGTGGTLSVPDPNHFDGAVRLFEASADSWRTLPPSAGFIAAARGYGLADMADALEAGRPHRASGEVAYHVLETMTAFFRSARRRQTTTVSSSCRQPDPVPLAEDPWSRPSRSG